MPKSVLRAVLGRMQVTLHATRRTPHSASRLVETISALLVKTRRAPSQDSKDARVYGHTTTVMHKLSTPPPPLPPILGFIFVAHRVEHPHFSAFYVSRFASNFAYIQGINMPKKEEKEGNMWQNTQECAVSPARGGVMKQKLTADVLGRRKKKCGAVGWGGVGCGIV